jgi:hypothetical protein
MSTKPTAVLVATTLPGQSWGCARVISTQDVETRDETTVIVQSLPELLAAVEAWWSAYWGLLDTPTEDP